MRRTAYDSETGTYYETDLPAPPRRPPVDVFICYNREDKTPASYIALQLREMGISPWFDEEQLRPGRSWSQAIYAAIEDAKSAAVFVGESGIGPWQRNEIKKILEMYDSTARPIIPVLLSTAPGIPKKLPKPLRDKQWVIFKGGRRVDMEDALENLYWGIVASDPR